MSEDRRACGGGNVRGLVMCVHNVSLREGAGVLAVGWRQNVGRRKARSKVEKHVHDENQGHTFAMDGVPQRPK